MSKVQDVECIMSANILMILLMYLENRKKANTKHCYSFKRENINLIFGCLFRIVLLSLGQLLGLDYTNFVKKASNVLMNTVI